jgi:hypothetical protein
LKTCDKVNGDFLFDCCRHVGLSDNWLTWIKNVVSGGTLSVKMNDIAGSYFGSFKGVRQGNPFAPPVQFGCHGTL